ncbi:ATP-binding cassette domain-containing protein [Bdellovibrio sp. HCB337]|uniref:ATP-binding cassette domain-containing protein n=1 Tax=Bdellovibrio sp. HCB337 TaxID=3394358 RepID=UPI0039A51A74
MENDFSVNAREVVKTYGGRRIFNGLNLKVRRGQFTVLLGKNGAGKSTLLRLIAGLEPTDSGEIDVLGSNVEFEDVGRRQKTAFISETISADAGSSIERIVKAYISIQPNWDGEIFNKFIQTFNLSLDKLFGSLSRGQKIQFFFALAAASKPDLYLLDEVTSVLDASARFEVLNHIRGEVARGASVLLATNIAAETHNFANEITFLIGGSTGLSCSVDELQTRFGKFRVPVESTSTFKIPDSARPVQLNRDGSISYLISSEAMPRDVLLDQRGVTIEDVFIYFTGPESAK